MARAQRQGVVQVTRRLHTAYLFSRLSALRLVSLAAMQVVDTHARQRQRALLACTFLAVMLAGCGGGGNDTAAPAPEPAAGGAPAPAPAPAPGPPPAPSPAPATASTCGLPDFAASALARVNQLRAAGASCGSRGNFSPAAALGWSSLLTQASDTHSRDMQAVNFFSHTGSSGSTLGQRVSATGYAWSSLGENIAAGQGTVNAVIDGWMASDGHCANLMNPSFNQFGLACVSGGSSNTYRTYWTMDLARSR
jgi:uncharacterized protein YkwD